MSTMTMVSYNLKTRNYATINYLNFDYLFDSSRFLEYCTTYRKGSHNFSAQGDIQIACFVQLTVQKYSIYDILQ